MRCVRFWRGEVVGVIWLGVVDVGVVVDVFELLGMGVVEVFVLVVVVVVEVGSLLGESGNCFSSCRRRSWGR